MTAADDHLVYVLGHPEAWRLLAILERGSSDRYERVRKDLAMHPQAFQRLLYWMRGYDLVRVRASRPAAATRRAVPVHLELSPRGSAMLRFLRDVERNARSHREALGLRAVELLSVA